MNDRPHILGLDFGPLPGFWHAQGKVHIESGHVTQQDLEREQLRYEVDGKNKNFILAQAFETLLARHGIPREIDLLVVEPAYGKAIKAAEARGALMSRIAARVTLCPPKRAWNSEQLKPAAIKSWASKEKGERVKDIHEAEAGRMALWGAGKVE